MGFFDKIKQAKENFREGMEGTVHCPICGHKTKHVIHGKTAECKYCGNTQNLK
jgi:ribosomal protein L37AE/L43A